MRDRTSRQQPKDLPIEPTTGTTETGIPIETPDVPRAGLPATSSTDVISQSQQQASQLMDKAQAQAKSPHWQHLCVLWIGANRKEKRV